MGAISDTGYAQILKGIGAPSTKENMLAFHAWQRAEGGTARFNPFNTTEPGPGTTNYNSVGVKNYANEPDGVDATVKTLLNGYYPAILEKLRAGNNGLAVCEAVDASPWGTERAAATYRAMFPNDNATPYSVEDGPVYLIQVAGDKAVYATNFSSGTKWHVPDPTVLHDIETVTGEHVKPVSAHTRDSLRTI